MFNLKLKKELKKFLFSKERGMIALTSVLIVLGIVLVLVSSVLSRSLSYSDVSSSQELSAKNLSFAEACTEHALMKLREDQSYSGDELLDISATSSCQILPVEEVNGNTIIKTKASVFEHIKRIKVELSQLRPKLQVESWREVQSF